MYDKIVLAGLLVQLLFQLFSVLCTQAINNLAVNDSNKQRIVDCGALPFYVQIMQNDTTSVEKSEAAHGIWTLAFNKKCKEQILQESGCVEGTLTPRKFMRTSNKYYI